MKILDNLRAQLATLEEWRTGAFTRMEQISSVLEGDEARSELNPEETTEFDSMRDLVRDCDSQIDEITPRIAELDEMDRRARESGRKVPNVIPSHDDDTLTGREIAGLSRSEASDRAMRLLEREDARSVAGMSSAQKDKLDGLLRSGSGPRFDAHHLAVRAIATENPHYQSAFVKLLNAGQRSTQAYLTNDEALALQSFEESRGMSIGTDTAGGFGVPVFIDPTIVLTTQGHTAVVLQECRHETITNDEWKGVTSTGSTWSFDGEAAVVSDDTPTLAQPNVPVHKLQASIPYSIEMQDYPNLAAELGAVLAAGYADIGASWSATGTGTSQPTGLFTALDANTNVEVTPTTDGAFNPEDISKVWLQLHERYREMAVWFMHTSVQEQVSQFGGAVAWDFTGDLLSPAAPQIRGKRVRVSDYFQTFVSGSTGALNLLVVGDPSNYLAVARAGMSLEPIPHLFNTANPGLPTGQRALYAWARVGGDATNDLGFRLLQNQ